MKLNSFKLPPKQLTWGALVFAYLHIILLWLSPNVQILENEILNYVISIFGIMWSFGSPIALLIAIFSAWEIDGALIKKVTPFILALIGVVLLLFRFSNLFFAF